MAKAILYPFVDTGGVVNWKCVDHGGRTEYFPACDREKAKRTAEYVLGVEVELLETPLTAIAAKEI